jgi:plastocyanin
MKKIIGIVLVLAIVMGVVVASQSHKSTDTAMNMDSSHSMGNMSADATSAKKTDQVVITNFKIAPMTITVRKGTKVTWTNKDSVAHTVTADTMPGPDSGKITGGATYSYTYTKTGTFTYYCDIHEDMKATVIVTE